MNPKRDKNHWFRGNLFWVRYLCNTLGKMLESPLFDAANENVRSPCPHKITHLICFNISLCTFRVLWSGNGYLLICNSTMRKWAQLSIKKYRIVTSFQFPNDICTVLWKVVAVEGIPALIYHNNYTAVSPFIQKNRNWLFSQPHSLSSPKEGGQLKLASQSWWHWHFRVLGNFFTGYLAYGICY